MFVQTVRIPHFKKPQNKTLLQMVIRAKWESPAQLQLQLGWVMQFLPGLISGVSHEEANGRHFQIEEGSVSSSTDPPTATLESTHTLWLMGVRVCVLVGQNREMLLLQKQTSVDAVSTLGQLANLPRIISTALMPTYISTHARESKWFIISTQT